MKQKFLQALFQKKRTIIKNLSIVFFTFSILNPAVNYAGFYHYEKEVAALVKVSGVVTDEKNKPLQGVNIASKDGKKGVVTDADGRYSIDVSDGTVLIFSSTGFA